jgi:hypothetical protein
MTGNYDVGCLRVGILLHKLGVADLTFLPLCEVFHFSVVTGKLSVKDKFSFNPSIHFSEVRLYFDLWETKLGYTGHMAEYPVAMKSFIFVL